MPEEPFIKRGVVEGETEQQVFTTDSDGLVKAAETAPRKCCGRCRCGAKEVDREDKDSQ